MTPAAYSVSPDCPPPAPGYASCLGLQLTAREPLAQPGARALSAGAAPASDPGEEATETTKPNSKALTPGLLLSAYGLLGVSPPSSQTIGIIDAYDDVNVESDLEVFDQQFGLAACNQANGCFRRVNQLGAAGPLPPSSGKLERGWAQEIATDVEVSHGLCPSCRIVLVEANSDSDADLFAAESTAVDLGALEISNSWGGPEPTSDSPVFDHPGLVITASAGDDGYLNWLERPGGERTAEYPASSPNVVGVGGTRLKLGAGGSWESETVWNDGGFKEGLSDGLGAAGGGCSAVFSAPSWQQGTAGWPAVGCGTSRAVADVAADADPYSGVAVYDSTEYLKNRGWSVIGGTSVASPIIAASFALAGGANGVQYPARTLYENEAGAPGTLHDVTIGSNGECAKPFKEGSGTSGCSIEEQALGCAGHAICLAVPGYDGPTGVGTPDGIGAFQPRGGSAATGGSGESGSAVPAVASSSPAPVSGQPPTGVADTPSGPAVSAKAPAPVLSGLHLVGSALAALARGRASLSSLSFAFTLSIASPVRLRVLRRVRVAGHSRWVIALKPLTISAAAGRQTRRLAGHSLLRPGRYELQLAPRGGTVRVLGFEVPARRRSA